MCVGFRGQIGNVDIYINGAVIQPECVGVDKSVLDQIGEIVTDYVYRCDDSDTCDHSFASNCYSGAIKKGKTLVGYSC